MNISIIISNTKDDNLNMTCARRSYFMQALFVYFSNSGAGDENRDRFEIMKSKHKQIMNKRFYRELILVLEEFDKCSKL